MRGQKFFKTSYEETTDFENSKTFETFLLWRALVARSGKMVLDSNSHTPR